MPENNRFAAIEAYEPHRSSVGQVLAISHAQVVKYLDPLFQIEVTAYYTNNCIICSIFYLCNNNRTAPGKLNCVQRHVGYVSCGVEILAVAVP